MHEEIPFILLSGMAADERLFAAQTAAFPNLRVQPWIEPKPGESLPSYAARVAEVVNPREPCIVGGASFGGVVALEMAPLLPALACVLIGSIRSPAELPRSWRRLRPLAILGPRSLQLTAAWIVRLGKWLLPKATVRRLRRLSRPESSFERWAICSLLRWKRSREIDRVPIYQIHGSADAVLPASLTQAELVVPGGAHALPLLNSTAVNDFLAYVINDVTSKSRVSKQDLTHHV